MIEQQILEQLDAQLSLPRKSVENALKLLLDGNTIPFISRYRKEATGGLDEVQLAEIDESYKKMVELIKRKEFIQKTIEEQGKWDEQLAQRVEKCWNSVELEDIYLPFKPKRATRGEMARKKGLEPLAKIIMAQNTSDLSQSAKRFLFKEVETEEDALKGARDIIAEWVNESEKARNTIRKMFAYHAEIHCKVVKKKEQEAEKYKDYFAFSEQLKRIPSHRLLAIRRGEKEGLLKVSIDVDKEESLERLERIFISRAVGDTKDQIQKAIKDAYTRLLKPSIETEFANQSKEKADIDAIQVFTKNLTQLLLAPPLGQKRVLGIDPGYRTGCKVVCLDNQGDLLHNENIYPHPPRSERSQAVRKLQKMVEAYDIEAIAIGNGTASRETEQFVQNISFDRKVQLFVVSESGASIYSASKIAREEFPEYDVTVRGAVSIGRRLIDPLAELVKIDPKSIGVGQYQHDVDQTKLKTALDQTVINAVNKVGVNLNTASKHLLTYISGLGAGLAQNIVDYRSENGAFTDRKELKKVPKLGAKTFEQSVAFLRISDGKNPLDNSAVHPESYYIVEKMAKDLHKTVAEIIGDKEIRKQDFQR